MLRPFFGETMQEIIITAIIGLLVGIGGTLGIQQAAKPKEQPPPIIVADPVAKELGRLDVVQPVCTPEFIEKKGDGLCKLLYCMTATNSATGEISGTMCDNISNVQNKKDLLEFCSQYDEEEKEKCVDVFFRRGS